MEKKMHRYAQVIIPTLLRISATRGAAIRAAFEILFGLCPDAGPDLVLAHLTEALDEVARDDRLARARRLGRVVRLDNDKLWDDHPFPDDPYYEPPDFCQDERSAWKDGWEEGRQESERARRAHSEASRT